MSAGPAQVAQAVVDCIMAAPDTHAPDPSPEEIERRRTAHNLAVEGKTKCDNCGQVYPTDQCWVMRVDFRRLPKRKEVRSRTVRKLCGECVQLEPAWNLPTRYT